MEEAQQSHDFLATQAVAQQVQEQLAQHQQSREAAIADEQIKEQAVKYVCMFATVSWPVRACVRVCVCVCDPKCLLMDGFSCNKALAVHIVALFLCCSMHGYFSVLGGLA